MLENLTSLATYTLYLKYNNISIIYIIYSCRNILATHFCLLLCLRIFIKDIQFLSNYFNVSR